MLVMLPINDGDVVTKSIWSVLKIRKLPYEH